MKNEILYVLLGNYADHEMPFLAQSINAEETGMRAHPKYVNKIVASSLQPVTSIGGFRILPDYTFDTIPQDYAALVLIGGYGWLTPEADAVKPLVEAAIGGRKIMGAICNAVAWMAKHGFLNHIKHTGNGVEQLRYFGATNYTNEANYVNEQAVTAGLIVTANGSAYLEFAAQLLLLLENDSPEVIDRFYQFNKQGLVKLFSPRPRFVFNTVGLFTRDNAKVVAFYRDVFGFHTEWNGTDPNVELTLGESRIILFPRIDFEQMTSHTYAYPNGVNGSMELSFDVPGFADVDREYAHALAHGASPIFPPTTEPWGQRTCYVADPEGNLIEISSFNP